MTQSQGVPLFLNVCERAVLCEVSSSFLWREGGLVPKWHPIPFIVLYFWSKVEQYKGNTVPFGIQPGREENHMAALQTTQRRGVRHSRWLCFETTYFVDVFSTAFLKKPDGESDSQKTLENPQRQALPSPLGRHQSQYIENYIEKLHLGADCENIKQHYFTYIYKPSSVINISFSSVLHTRMTPTMLGTVKSVSSCKHKHVNSIIPKEISSFKFQLNFLFDYET